MKAAKKEIECDAKLNKSHKIFPIELEKLSEMPIQIYANIKLQAQQQQQQHRQRRRR